MKPTNVIKTLAFAILAWYVFGLHAEAAILRCSKAQNKVERLICDEEKNPILYLLDSSLNVFYGELLKKTENTQRVVAEQKKWLKEVRNACADAECLSKVYRLRIGELQESATLCGSEEIVIYSCALPNRKIVSLCTSRDAGSSAGYMQYRMGRNQKDLEMQYPQKKSPAKNNFKYLGPEDSPSYGISFWLGNDRVSVFHAWTAKDDSDNHSGVIVSSGHPPVRVSLSECVREPIVFSAGWKYPTITFDSLGKELGLSNADGDISYTLGFEIKPGKLEE
jgi:uncharacterized protein